MRGSLDPTEILEDSLEAYFAPAPRGGGVYLALLAALCAGLAALPLVRVEVTARAPGMLRPAIERHRVAASASGVVRRVGVRLGEAVRAGQVLVELREDALAAGVLAADSALVELRARRADLRLLVGLAGALARGDSSIPQAARPRLMRYRAERLRALREWRRDVGEVAPADAAARRARALAARGLLAPAELEEALLRGERASGAPALAAGRLRAAWDAELAEVDERLRAAEAERGRLGALAELDVIRAPVAGTVEVLGALSPGSWLAAGEAVAEISPAAPLVAEVFLSSREVARVRPGLPVRLLVDALDRHEWGALPATVAWVGEDYALAEGRPGYRVRCALAAAELRRPDGRRARLRKGMGVSAVFVLGRRTLLHLLWDRAAARLESAVANLGDSSARAGAGVARADAP